MNTGDLCHSVSFRLARPLVGYRIDTVEVWGSSPHVPTISFNGLSTGTPCSAARFQHRFQHKTLIGLRHGIDRSLNGCGDCRQRFDGLSFAFEPDVTLVLQHLSGQMSRTSYGLVSVPLLRKLRNALVAHVVEPNTVKSSGLGQRPPSTTPRPLRPFRVRVTVLTRRKDVAGWGNAISLPVRRVVRFSPGAQGCLSSTSKRLEACSAAARP